MSILSLFETGRLLSLLFYLLEFQIFFYPLYTKENYVRGSLVSLGIYTLLFGVTPRSSFFLILLLHLLLILACSCQVWRETGIQYRYALYLSFAFILCRGSWNSQVMLFLFPAAAALGSLTRQIILNLISILILYGMRRLFLRVERQREITGSALFSAIFPPFIMFSCRIAIYHYLYYLDTGIAEETRLVFYLIGLSLGMAVLVSLAAQERYFAAEAAAQELERAQEQLQRQYRQFSQQRENDEKIKGIYHDMANHMALLAEMQNMESVRSYVKELSEQVENAGCYLDTGNETLNLILSQKAERCAEKGLELECALRFPAGITLQPMEICTLFANPIDNAMEALEAAETADRVIRVSGGEKHGCFVIRFENACDGAVDPALRTHKEGGVHGYGLKNVRSILERHDGSMQIHSEGGRFVLTMLIPIPAAA